jgi:hypothetical protein
MALLGCSGRTSSDSHSANVQNATAAARTAPASQAGDTGAASSSPGGGEPAPPETAAAVKPADRASGASRPFVAVNTVDALLPLGRTRGRLAVADGCVTFRVRDQLYTPVWPEGTRLSDDGARILGPAGESFPLGEDVTLDGAAFSLANDSMRLRTPLPGRCPNATYAVNL